MLLWPWLSTHTLFESNLVELVITDSRSDFTEEVLADEKMRSKVSIISIVPYLAEAIRRDLRGNTIKEMIRSIKINDIQQEKHHPAAEAHAKKFFTPFPGPIPAARSQRSLARQAVSS